MTATFWTLHRQQQQCGAQMPRAGGEAPSEATRDREAQDHEQAGPAPQAGESPASPIEHRDQDNTPTAPEPGVQWDEVVQPERQPRQGERRDDLPLSEDD
jgi:hypothetical protein